MCDTHTPLDSHHTGPVLPIFPFAPVRITEIVLVRRTFVDAASGFRSSLNPQYILVKFQPTNYMYI